MSDKFETFAAVIESADFGPSYEGETFVTVTFRCPVTARFSAGIWHLSPQAPGMLDWAKEKPKTPTSLTGGK